MKRKIIFLPFILILLIWTGVKADRVKQQEKTFCSNSLSDSQGKAPVDSLELLAEAEREEREEKAESQYENCHTFPDSFFRGFKPNTAFIHFNHPEQNCFSPDFLTLPHLRAPPVSI